MECSDQTAQCLRSLTVQKILANQISVSPVVDGFVLPLSLQIAAATGQFSRVPLINGSNHDEARFMYAMNELAGQDVSPADYPTAVIAGFGPQAGPLILAQYPLAAYVDADEALASIETDLLVLLYSASRQSGTVNLCASFCLRVYRRACTGDFPATS